MSKAVAVTSEYRNLPLAQLHESPTNPRRRFDEHSLNELPRVLPRRESCSRCLFAPSPMTSTKSLQERVGSVPRSWPHSRMFLCASLRYRIPIAWSRS